MTTPAQVAGDGSGDLAGHTPQPPARVSKRTIETAKLAASTAVEVLGLAAEMAENVPYLGAVSKALTTFKEVLEEVDVCKKDCKAAITEATEFADLMLEFEANAIPPAGGKEGELRKACRELGSALLNCLGTLQTLGVDSKRKRDRLMLFLKRGDVQSSVSECRDKMRIAKERFNMIVASDTNRVAHEIRQHLLPQSTAPPAQTTWRLRAVNGIFHGREWEVEAAVELIVNEAPARVAILGPGGIGKTSIALAVLHDPKVERIYGDFRCFMSCEAATTADAVVRALAEALHIHLEKDCSAESARYHLIQCLDGVSGIICFDNLETPLDADKRAAEELLNHIAALPSIALLITSRDTSIPTLKWTSPRLEHIKPFSQEAALATWDDICDFHDEYTEKLVEAVDCMPLAVTLLARLASIEQSAKAVWDRWEAEHTDMIRDGEQDDRLYSVSASIELSLRDRAEAATLLGIICVFPNGLEDDNITFLDAVSDGQLGSVRRSLTVLKRLSLVYIETPLLQPELRYIRVLSPIRHHIQQHHVADELFLKFVDIAMQYPHRWNCDAIVTFGWNRAGCRERCLQMVISFPDRTYNIEGLSQAIEKARELEPHIQSNLYRRLGEVLDGVRENERARSSFSKAIELDEQLGDRRALFEDWLAWVWNVSQDLGGGHEDECPDLDEVQNAIHKAWDLGRDECGVWVQDFYDYFQLAEAQRWVNHARRKLNMPIVHRSGLYSDNNSTVMVSWDSRQAAYDELVEVSPPPWDLSLILETIEKLAHPSEESSSSQESESDSSLAGSVGATS